ncbi:hypothetical protein R1flu_028613 [Riccia fluitans]|uniref:Uncharacterized protein n=1 Tax=Riccia fluitans TaxID=41844 RepID=A0ABD1XM70_9MARC
MRSRRTLICAHSEDFDAGGYNDQVWKLLVWYRHLDLFIVRCFGRRKSLSYATGNLRPYRNALTYLDNALHRRTSNMRMPPSVHGLGELKLFKRLLWFHLWTFSTMNPTVRPCYHMTKNKVLQRSSLIVIMRLELRSLPS